ncbi:unnamed protein product [Cuscuta europaea]|uniref:Receptor-like serine/threonine-protein kinase n=1 Tax=Cuscuta europaea TaxID=41803 RepID=A0A9P0Z1G8_CUSEU|nr:unnamed protein product [Cuscuta europaea]
MTIMKPLNRGLLFFFLIPNHLLTSIAISIDTITPTRPLAENQTLVSAEKLFELGFFTPGNSGKRYVGIWYKKLKQRTVVWVANRDKPLTNSPGFLKIGEDGGIHLVDSIGDSIWSSLNQTNLPVPRNNTGIAQLLNSGNFVLRQENDENTEDYLWQSFDHPTDTLLPGMKLGWDSKTGLNRYITSWRSLIDPSEGDISFKLDINGYPEAFLRNKDSILYRSGGWNGKRFSGVPEMEEEGVISFSFKRTEDEVYYSFKIQNETLYSRLIVNQTTGYLERYTWVAESLLWNRFWYAPKDPCDHYRECGAFGVCDTQKSPVCRCLVPGFKPRNQQAWGLRDGSGGCTRVDKLECEGDGFLALHYMKLPESGGAFVDEKMSLDECKGTCLKNCSCTAYSNANVSNGGSGCVIWSTELLDMRNSSSVGDQVLYVRVAAYDAEQNGNAPKARDRFGKKKLITLACGIILGIGVILSGLFLWKRRRSRRAVAANIYLGGVGKRSEDLLMVETPIINKRELSGERIMTDEFELPLFDLSTIFEATSNFSKENKLGQGGFGSVYKGTLIGGEEIAVKRLSEKSRQGVEEFKNELRLIARLQHRNLVRLLGCCVDNEEKILVYEYMENKSLDSLLFDKHKSSLLDWKRRFNIIYGIARGLLYLHQDSRFRIIHRDLKASNVLLDKEMNPKISDFGMARIFGGDETDANTTKRVVGTYGYMSPEYAMDGQFSVKSDVFSFGVLVLEVVSGKKNRGFYQQNEKENLLGFAWSLWRKERALELRDSAMALESDSGYEVDQVIKSIQVGLLCVQEKAEDRPTMAAVILMLRSEGALLPHPKPPGFCVMDNRHVKPDSSSIVDNVDQTLNKLTITNLDGR